MTKLEWIGQWWDRLIASAPSSQGFTAREMTEWLIEHLAEQSARIEAIEAQLAAAIARAEKAERQRDNLNNAFREANTKLGLMVAEIDTLKAKLDGLRALPACLSLNDRHCAYCCEEVDISPHAPSCPYYRAFGGGATEAP